jgi:hypothetical protein
MLITLHLLQAAAAQAPVVETRSKVEAAFLRNFARYVSWPPRAFVDDRAPWTICVLGEDHFGDALPDTLRGRTEQGAPSTSGAPRRSMICQTATSFSWPSRMARNAAPRCAA